MLQHMQHVPERGGAFLVDRARKMRAVPVYGVAVEAAPDGGGGEYFEGDRIPRPPEHRFQPSFVVLHVHLTADAKHFVQPDPRHVVGRRLVPPGAPQMVVQLVEEHLDMVRDAAAQPPAHVFGDLARKVDPVGFGERRQAGCGGVPAPRFQVVGGKDVGLRAQTGPLQDRFEADAARQDHRDPAAMRLAVPAQPAQERVRHPPPLRRHAVVRVGEQPVDQDRQLVQRQHHRLAARRQRREDIVAPLGPASGVDPGAQLDLEVRYRQLLDQAARPFQGVGEDRPDPVPRPAQRPRLDPDLGDRIRRVHRRFQVDEHGLERTGLAQPALQFAHQAGLPHAPLRRQQAVGPLPNALFQRRKLRLAIEEPVPVDPVASALCEHGEIPNNFLGNNIVGKNSTVKRAPPRHLDRCAQRGAAFPEHFGGESEDRRPRHGERARLWAERAGGYRLEIGGGDGPTGGQASKPIDTRTGRGVGREARPTPRGPGARSRRRPGFAR